MIYAYHGLMLAKHSNPLYLQPAWHVLLVCTMAADVIIVSGNSVLCTSVVEMDTMFPTFWGRNLRIMASDDISFIPNIDCSDPTTRPLWDPGPPARTYIACTYVHIKKMSSPKTKMTFGGDLSTLDPNVTLMNGTGPRTDNFLSLPSPEDAAVLLDLGLSPSPELLPQPIVHAMEVHEQLNYAPEYKKNNLHSFSIKN